MYRYVVYVLIFLVNFSLFSQRPDFQKLKSDIDSAATKEAKARAMADYAFAVPTNQKDEIIKMSENISELGENAEDPKLYRALSQVTKGLSYYRIREFKQAKVFLKKGIARLNELGDPLEIKALNLLGIVHMRTNAQDSAIYIYNDILSREQPLEKKAIMSAHGNLSNAYRRTGDYYEAISHMDDVYAMDSTNVMTVLQISMNTAKIYSEMGMLDKALGTLNSVEVDTFPTVPPKGVFYNHYANIKREQNEIDSALYYFKKAFKNSSDINYMPLMATDLAHVIEMRMVLDSFSGIEDQLEQMNRLIPKTQNTIAKVRYYILQSKYHKAKGEFNVALSNSKTALSFAKGPRFDDFRRDIYQDVIDLYNLKDDTKNAKLYIDSLSTTEMSPALKRKRQFEAEAKAKYLLAIKEEELSNSVKEANSFNLQRVVFLLLAVGLLLAVFFYFRNYRKSASGLEEQIGENEKLSKQVERQNTTIVELRSKAVLDAEEITFIKSDGHYLEFSLKSKKSPELDRNRLKDVLGKLPDYFVQIHRSYIINLKEVKIKYSNRVVMKHGEELPISRTYKAGFNQAIDKFNG